MFFRAQMSFYCHMELENFPFDRQHCRIELIASKFQIQQILYFIQGAQYLFPV